MTCCRVARKSRFPGTRLTALIRYHRRVLRAIARHRDLSLRLGASMAIGAAMLSSCGVEATPNKADAVLCTRPYIYDGDYIQCEEFGRSRLYGIDAPEIGGCRPGRFCVPGDPYDSRDNLRALVAKGNIMCRQLDTDGYRRPVLQCWNEDGDLSCQQVEAGQAIPRYRPLQCSLRR